LSKSVTQSEEEIKQRIIDCLKGTEWDIMQGKIDSVMMKLEEAQKLTREWRVKKYNSVFPWRAHIEGFYELVISVMCSIGSAPRKKQGEEKMRYTFGEEEPEKPEETEEEEWEEEEW